MNPIRLYVGEWYREPSIRSHLPILFPFWGVVAKDSMPYMKATLMQHHYDGKEFVMVADIADADYVVVPYSYEYFLRCNPNKVKKIIAEAQQAGKLLLIDASSDVEHPIEIPHSVILRQSQYRYAVKDNEITLPLPAEDLLESFFNSTMQVREYHDKPSVSFTGWAQLPFRQRVRAEVKQLPLRIAALFDSRRRAEIKGVLLRGKIIRKLAECKDVVSNFLIRTSYAGHVNTLQGSVADNRREFVENMFNSDYTLCVRGDGNSSIRFYEALSMGRIPLFIDTACVLPLEHIINYKEFCVFVDHSEIDTVSEKLVQFHRTHTPEQFAHMQLRAREVYETYLRTDVFPRYLAAQLRERADKFYETVS